MGHTSPGHRLGDVTTHFAENKILFLIRNLYQNMPKNVYSLEKISCKKHVQKQVKK